MFRRILSLVIALTTACAPMPAFSIDTPSSQRRPASSDESCNEAKQFYARLASQPGYLRQAYNHLICGLARGGTFAKLDALYVYAAETQQAANTNLAQSRFGITVHGSCTFGPGAGYMGDASSCYLDTGFVPSTAGGRYAPGHSSMGVGITNPRQSFEAWTAIGNAASDFSSFDVIQPLQMDTPSDDSAGNLQSRTPIKATGLTDARGAWIVNRAVDSGTGTQTLYRNGTSVGDVTGNSNATLPNSSIVVLALNCPACGGVVGFSGDSVAWAFIGGSLSASDIQLLTTLLNAFPALPSVAAAKWGFTQSRFSHNFAEQGLTGIDVNATLAPGYQLYTSWWFGCYSGNVCGTRNPPSSAYSYGDGVVSVGGSTSTARIATAGDTSAAFTGTSRGTTLTVSQILYGSIAAGQTIIGHPAFSGQTILDQLTGTAGGIGTYRLSRAAMLNAPSNLIASSYIGQTFAPGGYWEVLMNSDASLDTGSNGFPSAWLIDVKGLLHANFNSGYGAAGRWAEWDIFENKNGGRAPNVNGFDWANINGGQGTNNLGNDSNVRIFWPRIANPTANHYFGMLWVPSAKNGGTGLIQFFLDRTHLAGLDIVYSSRGGASPACSPSNPNGCMFISERGNFVFLIDGGSGGYSANVSRMDIWQ